MKVVFLFGPAAAGKYTVGKRLSESTGLALFHNHLAVDLALSLFDFGSDGFVSLRHKIWLQTFAEAARRDRSFIFTFQPEASVPADFPFLARASVEAEGGEIDFVELMCGEKELESRVGLESRAEFGKLNSLVQYRELRDSGAFEFPAMPEPRIRLSTEALSPAEAAESIARELALDFEDGS